MEDEINKHLNQEIEEAELKKRLYEQYLAELKSKVLLKEMECYDPSCIERFLQEYANKKVQVTMWGEASLKRLESNNLHWVNTAMKLLEEIQQKKMFDLQCLWRAEQIKLPEVLSTYDFQYWEYHIFQCPLLSPITMEEVELYQSYMNSNNYEAHEYGMVGWQDYDEIKEAYSYEDTDFSVPEWYNFHNSRTGNNRLLLLPDIRGEKEEYYNNLCEEERINKGLPPAFIANFTQTKPTLSRFDNNQLRWFVNTFEDATTRKYMENYFAAVVDNKSYYVDAIDLARELAQDGKIWRIKSNPDWFEALRECYSSYELKKTAEVLPLAFEQHEMLISSGIGIPDENPDNGKELRKVLQNIILKGRRLAGEEENFDF